MSTIPLSSFFLPVCTFFLPPTSAAFWCSADAEFLSSSGLYSYLQFQSLLIVDETNMSDLIIIFRHVCVSVCVTVSVSQKPGLDYINFSWNKMTAAEFEHQWKEKKTNKKADFIHLIQVVARFHPPDVLIPSYSLDECVLKTVCSG